MNDPQSMTKKKKDKKKLRCTGEASVLNIYQRSFKISQEVNENNMKK
jgi:hypothetical protein